MRTVAKVRAHAAAPSPSPLLALTAPRPSLPPCSRPPCERLYAHARTQRLESCVLWSQASITRTLLTIRTLRQAYHMGLPYVHCTLTAPGEYYAAVFTQDDAEVRCRLTV